MAVDREKLVRLLSEGSGIRARNTTPQ